MNLRKMLSAADGNEPPPEYIGKRQKKEPPPMSNDALHPPPAEYRASRPPVSRLSRAAAEAAAHVEDLQEQVDGLTAALSEARNKLQVTEMRLAQVESDKATLELRLENSEVSYRELRGRLDAAAGLMIDILSKHRQPTDSANVAATLGEQAVAEAIEPDAKHDHESR